MEEETGVPDGNTPGSAKAPEAMKLAPTRIFIAGVISFMKLSCRLLFLFGSFYLKCSRYLRNFSDRSAILI